MNADTKTLEQRESFGTWLAREYPLYDPDNIVCQRMAHAWNAALSSAAEAKGEAVLRLLLASRYSGKNLYVDDGELQDNTTSPFIDFLRDTPEEIQRKMVERAYSAADEADAAGVGTVAGAGNGDRMAIRMLVAAGFVTEAKANEALCIAHGFTSGELTPPAASAVPDGWQWVPVEPTPEMRAVFRGDDHHGFVRTTVRIEDFDQRYRAMLASAPSPESAGQSKEQ